MLLLGRRYLNGNMDIGECCVCGGSLNANALPVAKALGKTYTEFDDTIIAPGHLCCEQCQNVLKNRWARTKPIIVKEPGNVEIISKEDIWPILESPPELFVLSVPYSYKKHHWIHAGLSTSETMMIGTDNRTIIYKKSLHEPVKNAVYDLINKYGVTGPQIISGNYHPSIMIRVGATLDEMEKIIAEERETGLVEFLVKFCIKQKSKLCMKGDDRMITTDQKNAAYLLSVIAMGSGFRSNNGKQFWGSFFEHRINRIVRYDFYTAVHPAMHNLNSKPSRFDKENTGVVTAPLPLASFRCNGNWVWACTAMEFEDTKLSSDVIIKRRTPQDIFNAQRTFMPASYAMKDRYVAFQTILASQVYFLCETQSKGGLCRLLKKIKSIGGKRKSGYGVVSKFEVIEIPNTNLRSILEQNGKARRNLPQHYYSAHR